MKHKFLLLVGLLATGSLLANINHIVVAKVTSDPSRLELFHFVQDNQNYYSHWTPKWNYDKSKQELDLKLQEAYRSFASLPFKNVETYLLLGDIAHYLYNLDVANYNDSSIFNYNKAMEISPKEFRSYWFLGYHYAQSNVPGKAIDNLFKAQEILPSPQPADFWNEYAWATAVTNMPSHSIFAMDRVKELTGKPGSIEEQIGTAVRKQLVAVDKDSSYNKTKIWSGSNGEHITFTSRALGIKMLVDSTWKVSIYDYANRTGAFIINPPTIKNKQGREIHYTVALLIRVADNKEKLDDYLQRFVSKFTEKKKIKFSEKYDKMITYEMKDKTMYPDIGGGHLYMIGVERNEPKSPGLLLENPLALPFGKKKDEVSYFKILGSKNRFRGKIFYGIMLDSCEDIHDESRDVFKEFFEKQMVIE